MPFFDKMKEQAGQVAAKAQEAGKAGQAKIEGAQAKREADGLLRRLGAAVYAERTGGHSDENIDELIASISAHEAEHGSVTATDDDETPTGAPSAPSSEASAGDFKL